MIYTATYTATLNTYTVTFVVNGQVYAEVDTQYGNQPEMPADPSVSRYEFDGWDVDMSTVIVTGDMTINAVMTRLHKVTFYRPAIAGGGSRTYYVRDGETVAPYDVKDTEDYDFKWWYRYPETHTKGFDFSTPIHADTRFDARVVAIRKTRDLQVYGTVNGESFYLGMGTIDNMAVASEYAGIKVAKDKYTLDAIHAPSEFPSIVVNGITYTYGKGTSANYYTYTATKSVSVVKVDGVYVYQVNGTIELYHKVTFSLPAYAQQKDVLNKKSIIVYVRDGETVAPAEVPETADERVKFWYEHTSTHTKSFNFNTPITSDMKFTARVELIAKTRDVQVYGTLNGKNYKLGMGTIENMYNAKEYNGIYNNIVQTSKYAWSQIDLGTEYADITVDGVTYTYGKGSSANYYTYTVTKKLHVVKDGSGFTYRVNGEINLFHNVKINLGVETENGFSVRRVVKINDVAHGTVITGQWLRDNRHLPMGLDVEDIIVIDSVSNAAWIEM